MRNEFGGAAQTVQYGTAEICDEPCVAGLTRERGVTARRSVSIGKKTVGRSPRVPV